MSRRSIRVTATPLAVLSLLTLFAVDQASAAFVEVTPAASAVTASTNDGNGPGNAVDNSLSTRWAGAGDGAWLKLDLGTTRTISHVNVAIYNGNARRNRFELQTSTDDSNWTNVFNGESSGTTTNEEMYEFTDRPARYVRYLGHLSNIAGNNFNSVTEVSVFAPQVAPNTVSITGSAFQPASITIAAGDTVTWVNNDSIPHTVTDDGGAFDSGTIAPGGSYARTFTTGGTSAYHCEIHPGMTGTVVVTGGATPSPTPTTPPTGECVKFVPAPVVSASTSDTNVAAGAVDNNLATRWSGNGDGAWINFDLGAVRTVCYVKIAFFSGNLRASRFDLQASTNGTTYANLLTNAMSSGTTTNEETFDFADADTRIVRYLGHGNNDPTKATWNSLAEVSIYIRTGDVPTPTPTPTTPPVTPTPTPTTPPVVTPTPTPTATTPPVSTPTPTPTSPGTFVEITPDASGVTASTSDGNGPGNVVDNDLATRWSGNGDGAWIRFDLGFTRTVTHVTIAVYNGTGRQNRFDLQGSNDGTSWSPILTNVLSTQTANEEPYEFNDVNYRYVRYLGHMSNVGSFNSLTEVSLFGPGGPPTPSPTPTTTPTITPTPTTGPSPTPTPTGAPGTPNTIVLRGGWRMQSSASVTGAGAQISMPGYSASSWYPVTLPATVLAGLIQNGQHTDIFQGRNMSSISTAPFQTSWWYRTEFQRPDDGSPVTWLGLDGLNFRANVWLNGVQVANSTEVAGTFRTWEWNVTSQARRGQTNALAIQVFPSASGDLTLTWNDWNPAPPDRNLGIYRDVKVKTTGPVAIRGVLVRPRLDTTTLASADIDITAELQNTTSQSQSITLSGTVGSVSFSQGATLAANESRNVLISPATQPQLRIANPQVWWPHQMGAQPLYNMHLDAMVAGNVSDTQNVRFGVRDVSHTMQSGRRLYRINGRNILIRGGGATVEMLLRSDPDRLDSELRLIKEMGLNAIRLEGKFESQHYYDKADELGLLLMPGWMCCDKWESYGSWSDADRTIARASMLSQAKQLRNHPSVFTFLIGSDAAPPGNIESLYLSALNEAGWYTTINSGAKNVSSPVTGPSGMKMPGPYDWVGPIYWMQDTGNGGAFGFASEEGPGPAIPELEILQSFMTSGDLNSLWTNPSAGQYHAGTGQFSQLRLFNNALNGRHGTPGNLENYVRKAQLMNYEGERAPFEAFGRNKYTATGYIHWMLNNSWPSLIWHLYDYSLMPAASYFGAKKGNEPVHILYSYDNRSIAVLNHTRTGMSGLTASATVYNLDGSVKYTNSASVSPGADSTTQVFTIPAISGLSSTYFVKLDLTQGSQTISRNFYWLSTRAEVHNYGASDWYFTPVTTYSDFTALNSMASANVNVTRTSSTSGSEGETRVTVQNTSSLVAFFIRARLTRGAGGTSVAPIFWDDNYISLAPGETREIVAKYSLSALGGSAPSVTVQGWNVASQTR
jgi:exo-1,4-beta-D-glucosaminidase